MVHRGIATLAGLLAFCYFLLSHLEPEFFLLHLYQSLIYLVIILMLFYLEDQYAYMLGMIAPSVWIILSLSTGLMGMALRQVWWLVRPPYPEHRTDAVGIMAAITAVMAVLMIGFCAQRWKREFAGLGKGWHTFGVSFGIIVVYYGVLVFWFTRLIGQH
ncbi:MAG: hypothetical protein M1453_10845 [Acidobacteria bacterium]|nr:hypothetical protein [Acidobacteriota bacterium]MCL5288476.1 hypothetical protein [Acidobacteriota bacterium]